MSLELLTPEQRLEFHVKMDAVSTQGWVTDFPVQATVGPVTHGRVWWAGIYRQLLEEDAKRRNSVPELTPKEVRDQLLDEVVRRITEADNDDIILILAG